MSFATKEKFKKKEENPLCKTYDYAEKIYWAGGQLFPDWDANNQKYKVREKGQYNIVQVFADGENTGIGSLGNIDNWECENENNTKDRQPEWACWYTGNKKVVASFAAKRSGAEHHTEDLILNHIDKLHSTDETSEQEKKEKNVHPDEDRDLVIISTASPCATCYEMESIEKMCNGINKEETNAVWIDSKIKYIPKANATPRFRKCYFLYSIKFPQEREHWDSAILKKYDGKFVPIKCDVPPSHLNPYYDENYKPKIRPILFKGNHT